MNNKMELLAPAGNLEKLKIAVTYGADAVYFGGEAFSLRAGAGNFTIEEMKEGIAFAHERGVKCYLTLNIFAHNGDIEPLKEYLAEIRDIGLDACLISDPGILFLVRSMLPDMEIHLSTQANMTNYMAGQFWHEQGVRRLVLARELSLKEIHEMRRQIPQDMELESFVHGAMCISYSGRCLLSSVMTGRDANRGLCAHPCRYSYALMEEKRPGEYFPVEEDIRGTYIMNSKDLCMIRHIPDLAEAGISSAKIEGRMKSIYYIAVVIHAYRQALDAYYADPEHWEFREEWFQELCKASHREFSTGFYFGPAGPETQNYQSSRYIKEYTFAGLVKDYDASSGTALVEQRNKVSLGEEVEVFGPDISFFTQKIEDMRDAETGELLESAPHAQQMLKIKMEQPVKPGYMLRKRV